MEPRRRFTNKDKLTFSFIGLLFVGLLASTLVAYQHVKGWQNKAIRDELQLHASLTAADIKNWVLSTRERVEHLAQWLSASPNSLRNTASWAEYLTDHPEDQTRPDLAYALESDGFYISNFARVPAGYDPRVRPWYQEGKAAMAPIVTKPYLNVEAEPHMEVAIVAPIMRNGEFLGLAGDHISMEALTDSIANLDMGHNGHGFLIDRDGHIIVHADSSLLGLDWQPSMAITTAEPTSHDNEHLSLQLMESADYYYYITARGPQLGWSLVLAVPKAEIQLELLQQSAIMLSHFLLIFCLVMVGFYLSNRHILTPLMNYMELDSVTLLPNKKHFKHQVKKEFLTTNHPGKLLIITLDNYSGVTATYSASQVHLLQNEIKKRIQSKLCPNSLLGVFSESRYITYSHCDNESLECENILKNLSAVLGESYNISGNEINCTFRIGASLFPEHGTDIEGLIDNAFSALGNIQKHQKMNYAVFRAAINQQLSDEWKIFSAMKTALRRGEFHMVYQPQYDLLSSDMIGAEALIRWDSSELGRMVSPAEFIPIAEKNELVVEIGQFVIDAVLHQLHDWQHQGLDVGRISINLSPRQLLYNGFFESLMASLANYQIEPSALELEITETSVLENPLASIAVLQRLKDAGFHIAMDDFGTGYSSLEYLHRLPIDKLKIDRSFVVDLDKQEKSGVIVQMIIAMANSLELMVIAEGVETVGEARLLCHQGCRQIQGYLFARPMEPEELQRFISQWPSTIDPQLLTLERRHHSVDRRQSRSSTI